MRKTLLVAAVGLALAISSQAKASLLDASIFGGYTTLAMDDINNDMPTGPGMTLNKITGGYYVGAEGAFTVMPFLKIGPRIEYIAGSGSVEWGGGGPTMKAESTLIPLLLGVSTDWALPGTGFSVKGGLYGGYGLGALKTTLSGPVTGAQSASGNGFVGEIAAQARYSILPTLSLGLDLGYRMAKIASMKADSYSGVITGNVGDTLKTSAGKDMAVDFSGLNIGGALAFNF